MANTKELEKRKGLLDDLVLHLTKVTPEQLEENTVQEIVEGFWMSLESQAISETKPFELTGE